MNYNLKWYHYSFIPLYYLMAIVIFASFTLSFTLNTSYFLILRIPISFLFFTIFTLSLISHWSAMQCNNSCEDPSIESLNQSDNKCSKCHTYKQRRAHHCSTCDICISKMDHHCPWIANCVGEYNKKSFILFLFYTSLGCFIAGVCIAKTFIINLAKQSNFNFITTTTTSFILTQSMYSYEMLMPLLITIGFFISIIMTITVFLLLCIQITELNNGMTGIEFMMYKNKSDCPYYKNDFKENFKEVFGNEIWSWFLPFNNSTNNIVNNDYVPLL